MSINLCKTPEYDDIFLVSPDLQNLILETLCILYTYWERKDHSTSKSVSIANCRSFKDLDRLHMLGMAAAIQIYSEDRPW